VRAVAPLELAIERAGVRIRFTWAFHAREVRFERATRDGFEPLFPETFSFHLQRHDPFELQLQLEDLWSDPRRLGPGVTRRDAQELVRRLLVAAPPYLEAVLDHLAGEGRLVGATSVRVHADLVVLARAVARFLREKELESHPEARFARFHLRKLVWRAASALVAERVGEERLERWVSEGGSAARPARSFTERELLEALASGTDEVLAPLLLLLAERAFHRWLEDSCLATDNEAFESEGSPFADRETEVLAVVSTDPERRLRRVSHLSPFLRRRGSRDCQRLLRVLGVWFLRQYDVPRAAALIRHQEDLARGRSERPQKLLSLHATKTYLAAIALLLAPFAGAAVGYERAPHVFDAVASLTMLAMLGSVLWYLLVRFLWQKDLAFFHSAVPRIGAGIIVGYMPVFLIDEVWDLARRPWFPLSVTAALMGTTTLLYIYVEVRGRIADPREAFARARRIFLLGLLEAQALGLVVTSLLGPFMAARTWGEEGRIPFEQLREITPAVVGELPRIMGFEPFYVFPTAVLLMTFFSLFIGTFLQLLWEDLPITEPL
jgi:hypothetical protein